MRNLNAVWSALGAGVGTTLAWIVGDMLIGESLTYIPDLFYYYVRVSLGPLRPTLVIVAGAIHGCLSSQRSPLWRQLVAFVAPQLGWSIWLWRPSLDYALHPLKFPWIFWTFVVSEALIILAGGLFLLCSGIARRMRDSKVFRFSDSERERPA